MKIIGLILCMTLTGCALTPDSIRPEIEHLSHTTQHWPIASHADQTHLQVNTLEIMAHWDVAKVGYLEIGEGLALEGRWNNGPYSGYGEVQGPREQFIARAGLIIPLK